MVVFFKREVSMSAEMLVPVRHDLVSFVYHGKTVVGEVRRVYEKPKGMMLVVKIDDNQYRSCYMDQMQDLVVSKP
jgi:ribosomal protein S4E